MPQGKKVRLRLIFPCKQHRSLGSHRIFLIATEVLRTWLFQDPSVRCVRDSFFFRVLETKLRLHRRQDLPSRTRIIHCALDRRVSLSWNEQRKTRATRNTSANGRRDYTEQQWLRITRWSVKQESVCAWRTCALSAHLNHSGCDFSAYENLL